MRGIPLYDPITYDCNKTWQENVERNLQYRLQPFHEVRWLQESGRTHHPSDIWPNLSSAEPRVTNSVMAAALDLRPPPPSTPTTHTPTVSLPDCHSQLCSIMPSSETTPPTVDSKTPKPAST